MSGDTFYFSEGVWETLKSWTWAEAEKLQLPDSKGGSVSFYIERHYQEWISGRLSIPDSADLVRLVAERRAQGKGGIFDGVVWTECFGKWERRPHELSLSYDCIVGLAEWNLKEGIWRRQRRVLPVSLAGSAIELIGRGWWKSG